MEADLRKKNSSLPFLYIEKIKPFLLLIHKRKSKINLTWKLSHMTAAMNDVDEETLKSLHVMCVTEVRKINGIIDYEDAVEYQRE